MMGKRWALLVTVLALLPAGAAPGPAPRPAGPLPAIIVEAVYPGANAQVVADTVAAPIEQQLKGVDKMLHLLSRCASDGTCTLTATFAPGVDLDAAHVQVTKRVISAHSALPDVVKRGGVTIKKKPAHVLLLAAFSSPGGTW